MITNISGQGFKGLDFDQPLDEKNLIVGPNGSGKSARTNALQLLVSGYVPGVGKKNADILDTFGSGDKLFVSGKINGTHFTRRFCRDKKGSVSQDFLVDRRKATKTKFIEAMAKAKAPIVLDLDAVFLSLSDQKKIDYLFSLFPPADDVSKLDEEIELTKEKKSAITKNYTAKKAMVSQLNAVRSEIVLPAGTLAEIQAEIEKTKLEYKEKNKMLAQVKADIAAREAREKAKAKAEAEAKAQREESERKAAIEKERAVREATKTATREALARAEESFRQTESSMSAKQEIPQHPDVPDAIGDKEAAAKAVAKLATTTRRRRQEDLTAPGSIRRIMAVAEKVDAMAVIIVCKKELKKWGE